MPFAPLKCQSALNSTIPRCVRRRGKQAALQQPRPPAFADADFYPCSLLQSHFHIPFILILERKKRSRTLFLLPVARMPPYVLCVRRLLPVRLFGEHHAAAPLKKAPESPAATRRPLLRPRSTFLSHSIGNRRLVSVRVKFLAVAHISSSTHPKLGPMRRVVLIIFALMKMGTRDSEGDRHQAVV